MATTSSHTGKHFLKHLGKVETVRYARENNFIPSDIDGEEEYLLMISDTDAYQEDHFINYTQQPLLKVLSWRHWLKFEIFKYHAKYNLKIFSSVSEKLFSLFIIISKFIFKKIKLNIKYESPIERKLNKFSLVKSEDGYFNLKNNFYYSMYILPWNSLTYPFLVLIIGYKFTKGVNKKLLILIFEHIKYSFSFVNLSFPNKSLRKIVDISGEDAQIRRGR